MWNSGILVPDFQNSGTGECYMPTHFQWGGHKNISYRKLTLTNFIKDLLEIMKVLFVHLWNLWLCRRFLRDYATVKVFKFDL
jgi:hypothetical protein